MRWIKANYSILELNAYEVEKKHERAGRCRASNSGRVDVLDVPISEGEMGQAKEAFTKMNRALF